mgnify:CR=1 FL=1
MRYYYGQLSRPLQSVYDALLGGFCALAPGVRIPMLDEKQLADVYLRLKLDEPLLFYVTGYRCRWMPGAAHLELLPEYLFDKNKIREHQRAMSSRVEKLARAAKDLSEWEKEKYIHDFICDNVTYDKLKKAYSHEIIGPLGHGVGVCEGIAKSVKILCDALGIWCMIAVCGNNPEKGIKYRHTWNIVKIGGTYYHLDATFDNTLGKHSAAGQEIRYDYFNLDDKKIFRDHEPLIAPAPVCTNGDHFYYREKKLSFTKEEDVYKRSLQAAKKGRTLTFQWRGGYLTREVLEKLLDLLRKAGEEKQKAARISLNWSQAVIRVSYVEDRGLACVDMEEANEGEKE